MKGKKKIIIISAFAVFLIILGLMFLPLQKITIDETNVKDYFDDEITVTNYKAGLPLNYALGISNYSSSEATYNVTVKPKYKGYRYENVTITYRLDAFLWLFQSGGLSKTVDIDDDGNGKGTYRAESVSMQLFSISAPSADDFSMEDGTGYIRKPLIDLKLEN